MASKRKGKPLLVATIGLATISFAACKDAPKDDAHALDPHENTAASAIVPVDSAAPAASVVSGEPDAGTTVEDAGDAGDAATPPPPPPTPTPTPKPTAIPSPPKPPRPPVGNLRPPPPPPPPPPPRPPVGNLRPPPGRD